MDFSIFFPVGLTCTSSGCSAISVFIVKIESEFVEYLKNYLNILSFDYINVSKIKNTKTYILKYVLNKGNGKLVNLLKFHK